MSLDPKNETGNSVLSDLIKVLSKLAVDSIGDSRIACLGVSLMEDYLDAFYGETDTDTEEDTEEEEDDDGPVKKKLKLNE